MATSSFTLKPYPYSGADCINLDGEMGYLEVPENLRNWRSRKTQLAALRLKNRSSHLLSPIVYLAGGPGGPARSNG